MTHARTDSDVTRTTRVLMPLRDFLATESAGAKLLALGAIVALVWVNSPWSESYVTLWETRFTISMGGHGLDLDLRHFVNDGLMTVFFLIVGLEIKRELTTGHLSTRRAALLPAAAAIGGMVLPALVFLAVAGSSASRGWAIPMATDIALAVGVLTIAGDRVPPSLRAFLLGLAIVDDIGAIVVIALFYSSDFAAGSAIWALAGVAAAVLLRRFGVHATWAYVVAGAFVWFNLHEAGIHPTIAGVVMGLLAPTIPRRERDLIDGEELLDLSDVEAARTTSDLAKSSISVVEWLQHVLHPWTGYVIVPIFALANSGIEISIDGLADAVRSPLTWGIFLGLTLGKPIGVVLATQLAVRSGIADRPQGTSPVQTLGVGTAAGIGFTVSLFITELAFTDEAQIADAKTAILAASVVAAVAAAVLLTRGSATAPGQPLEPQLEGADSLP